MLSWKIKTALFFPLAAALQAAPLFQNVTSTHVPTDVAVHSMDAEFGDFDKDGDLDVAIAMEYAVNRLYVNDGQGRLTWRQNTFANVSHDDEDLQIADFNRDGNLDVVFVAEDDFIPEYYLGNGNNTFQDVSSRIPRNGEANDVEVADLNGDNLPDIIVGNAFRDNTRNGQDFIFINNPANPGFFLDQTSTRLPATNDNTQDIKLGDLDGDGDLDMVVGNDIPPNKLYLNRGDGTFADSSQRLDLPVPLETREVLLFDADGDRDLDIVFCNLTSNAGAWVKDPQARILINDGRARFRDETAARMPPNTFSAWDGGYLDFDMDNDIDLILCAIVVPGFQAAPFRAYRNNGAGVFTDATADVFPAGVTGYGWDVEVGDLNRDGVQDLFLSGRQSQNLLLLGIASTPIRFPGKKPRHGKKEGNPPRLWVDAAGQTLTLENFRKRPMPAVPIYGLGN